MAVAVARKPRRETPGDWMRVFMAGGLQKTGTEVVIGRIGQAGGNCLPSAGQGKTDWQSVLRALHFRRAIDVHSPCRIGPGGGEALYLYTIT